MDASKLKKAKSKKKLATLNACRKSTPLVVKAKRVKDVKIGQGEGETKWKGCAWKLLLFKYTIFLEYFLV